MKKTILKELVLVSFVLSTTPQAWSSGISTDNQTGTVTSALRSTLQATPIAMIRFELASAKLSTTGNQLSISITVDSSSSNVTTGIASNYAFQDESVGAAYFGYYLSTGVKSVHCGPNYAANGLSGSPINCPGGSTIADMDITQFVKVSYDDPVGSVITSQLEFIAEVE